MLLKKVIDGLHRAGLIRAFRAPAGENDPNSFVARQWIRLGSTVSWRGKRRGIVQLQALHWLAAHDPVKSRGDGITHQNSERGDHDYEEGRDKTGNDRIDRR